jgi:hypothetical protein
MQEMYPYDLLLVILKSKQFLPGESVVRTTMSMACSLEGRSMTRGVNRPLEPACTHSVMPRTLASPTPSWAAKSLLRWDTDRPSNCSILQMSGLMFP